MGAAHVRREQMVAQAHALARDRAAAADALAIIVEFNARLDANRPIWAWPSVLAALVSRHPWLVIVCDACEVVTELDLRVKRRAADDSIRIALTEVKCIRCNGHGRPRIVRFMPQP